MIGENTAEYVHKAIEEELKFCIEKHGLFHNYHEAWAVLLEETQEVAEECIEYQKNCNKAMQDLWAQVKDDTISWRNSSNLLIDIKSAALDVLFECVQVCAMCNKWMDMLEEERPKGANIAEGA